MVSNVRMNGRKLYEYARNHEHVERVARNIHIYEIEALDEELLKFCVACSAGTYIRSLCVDIAAKSGNLGCMDTLIRTRVGRFTLADCVRLDAVANGDFSLVPIRKALAHYPQIPYEPITDIVQGKKITLSCVEDEVAILDRDEVMAIYRREQDEQFRCVRGLW